MKTAILALCLAALATPAAARHYSFWRCNGDVIDLSDSKWKSAENLTTGKKLRWSDFTWDSKANDLRYKGRLCGHTDDDPEIKKIDEHVDGPDFAKPLHPDLLKHKKVNPRYKLVPVDQIPPYHAPDSPTYKIPAEGIACLKPDGTPEPCELRRAQ
jgi:hypothetical protein